MDKTLNCNDVDIIEFHGIPCLIFTTTDADRFLIPLEPNELDDLRKKATHYMRKYMGFEEKVGE